MLPYIMKGREEKGEKKGVGRTVRNNQKELIMSMYFKYKLKIYSGDLWRVVLCKQRAVSILIR